jgi:LPXTG-motif cell wall-anchored protein
MKKLQLFLSALFLMLCFGLTQTTYARTDDYTVKPIIPENQLNKDLGYFDLTLGAGKEQTLQVEVSNNTEQEMKVDLTLSSAVTNQNGLVVYEPTKIVADSSLKYNLKDFVKAPKVLTLAPLSRQKVEISVSMPKEEFNGQIAGGITFSKEGQNDKEEASEGITVKNTYSYTIALLMKQNDNEVSPDLNLKKINPSQINGRNVISVNLQNPTMTYINTMNVKATITSISNSEIKYVYSNSMMQMAPNTNFALAIPTSDQSAATRVSEPLKPGKYRLQLVANARTDEKGKYEAKVDNKTERYKYQWTFDREFIISDAQAQKLNNSDPTVKREKDWTWLLLIIGLLLLALLFLIMLWKRRKKSQKEEEEKQAMREKIEAQEKIIDDLNKK